MIHSRNLPKSGKNALVAALCLGLGLWLAACNGSGSPTAPSQELPDTSSGSGGGGGTGGTTGSSTGSVTVRMTDAPTDEICELNVTIQELKLKPQGLPVERTAVDISVDLLELQNGSTVTLVDGFEVPLGTYQFIELLLEPSSSSVVEMDLEETDPVAACDLLLNENVTEVQLQVASNKIKVKGGTFVVGASTQILIDFDASKSLKRKGSSKNPKGWLLTPNVVIVSVN